MRINAIRVRNYRSLKDVSWTPGELNLLIGPNGAGKSNVLRAFEMIKLAATGPQFAAELLSQGGISKIAWDGKAAEISWTVMTGPSRFSPQVERLFYTLSITPSFRSPSGFNVDGEAVVEELAASEPDGENHRTVLRRTPQKIELVNQAGELADLSAVSDDLTPPSVPGVQTFLALSPFSQISIWELREYFASWGIYHDIPVHQGAEI